MSEAESRPADGVGQAPEGIRLTLGALTIDVSGDDPTDLGWLAEFLGPAFAARPRNSLPAGTDEAQHVLHFERAPAEHARLRRALASVPLQEIEAFTLDGSFSCHRGWDDPDGRRWIHDKQHDAFYGVDPEARSIRVVAPADSTLPRLGLMRVVRELATTALLRSARLPVHGAAFIHEDAAILVCGPRRSGKTSLLIHALRCGAAFIANDRLFLDTAGPVVARAMPTIVVLRDGSLAFFEELKQALEEARFDRSRTIAECAPGIQRSDPHSRSGRRRRGISPAQLCQLLGTSMRPSARVGMLLFPRIDPDADGVVLQPLAAGPAREIMGRSLLKPSHPTRSSQFFSPRQARGEIPAEVESRQCRELVERVPVYDCRLGPNAFQTDLGPVLRQHAD